VVSRNLTAAEMEALNRMKTAGDVSGLGALLADETKELHPVLRRELVKLIQGSAADTDFRLTAVRHPDLARKQHGRRARLTANSASLQTALIVRRHGGHLPGQWEAAIAATVSETGLSRSEVTDRWARHKETLSIFAAHGVLKA
jgi:hypothetical protein